MAQIEPPLLTCEAVIAESCFLLCNLSGSSRTVAELIHRKIIEIPFRLEAHAQSLAMLLDKYSDVPMSLADACLVRMSELYENSLVFTLDHDFKLYRRHGRQVIAALMPTRQ